MNYKNEKEFELESLQIERQQIDEMMIRLEERADEIDEILDDESNLFKSVPTGIYVALIIVVILWIINALTSGAIGNAGVEMILGGF